MSVRYGTALHEAGHILVAWLRGGQVRSASALRERNGAEGLVVTHGLPRDAQVDYFVAGAAAEAAARGQRFEDAWRWYAGEPGDGLDATHAARAVFGRYGGTADALVLERGRAVTAELRGSGDVLAAIGEALAAHGALDAPALAALARACGMPSSAWRG